MKKDPGNPGNICAFKTDFARKTGRMRIPVSGGIEITRQCNLSCLHCYLGKSKYKGSKKAKEIGTKTWKRIIDEIVDAGCLFLVFTGGDPLLRQDFADIYSHARKSGMVVTVFTNATRLPAQVLRTFEKYPPNSIEISIYGATPETYRAVTRKSGEFENCLSNTNRLVSSGFQVELKTILMTKNRHELDAMRKIADDLGVKFRFDAAIFPGLDGDKKPLSFRVSPEEAVSMELSFEATRKSWMDFFERVEGLDHRPRKLYDCGAGWNNFHIDFQGKLQPCLIVRHIRYDLVRGNFSDGWRNVIPGISKKKAPPGFACRNCEKYFFCGICPAFSRLENGSETSISNYLCAMGNIRYNKLMKNYPQGEKYAV